MDAKERYMKAAHAMQSGVAMEMNYDSSATTPKHLRVGINAAMSDMGGLTRLLISKGVFTEQEYVSVIADKMEEEAESYAKKLSERLGKRVVLA
jgi:L-rhamnose isomerase